MTQLEHRQKRERLAVSEAPHADKQKAIKELDDLFYGSSAVELAKQQFEESRADTNDIGQGD